MNYLNQILFFFGAIGAFNSFVLAIYVLSKKSGRILSNRLIGWFLLILSLRVLNSLFYAFSSEEPIWFLQFGPSYFLLIGPLFFSYTTSIINSNSLWVKYWKQHLLFWLTMVVLCLIFIPFRKFPELNKTIILTIVNAQWLVYILLAILFIKLPTDKPVAIKRKWLLFLSTSILILWAAYAFIEFKYFVSAAIIFSILFYVFFGFFLVKKQYVSKIFESVLKKKSMPCSAKELHIIEKLHTLMHAEKLYLDPNLKLSDLAFNLRLSQHELSKLLNDYLLKNFTDFINEYRIQEAKRLIQENSLYTMEAIGNHSGFHSKSAFYKAFKKHTLTTPAKFKAL